MATGQNLLKICSNLEGAQPYLYVRNLPNRHIVCRPRLRDRATYAPNGIRFPEGGFARSMITAANVCPCDR